MKIVVISDTHNLHQQVDLPCGDLLIHCGDFSSNGSLRQIEQFSDFLETLSFRYKIVIAGNHDLAFEQNPIAAKQTLKNCIYLQDESVEIEGIKFYGTPWQPEFLDLAFNLKRGAELRKKWDLIPQDVDILITHTPPYGIRDDVRGRHVGCEELLDVVEKRQPQYHLFGHIHEGYGIVEKGRTVFMNAAVCDVRYKPINLPLIFDYH